jgi:hypothetical protein
MPARRETLPTRSRARVSARGACARVAATRARYRREQAFDSELNQADSMNASRKRVRMGQLQARRGRRTGGRDPPRGRARLMGARSFMSARRRIQCVSVLSLSASMHYHAVSARRCVSMLSLSARMRRQHAGVPHRRETPACCHRVRAAYIAGLAAATRSDRVRACMCPCVGR